MTTKYKLYGRAGSGSWAVQVALEEAGIPYERIWVGREAADVDKFKKINPTGKVPALVLPDGTVMFESAAMLLYIAARYPGANLAPPSGSDVHALFLQWMVFLSANLYESALRMYYPARYSSKGEADAEAVKHQAATDFRTHISLIGKTLRPYVLGTEFSIADVYLHMLASWYLGERGELHARLPLLGAHWKLLAARPAVSKVEADHVQ
jgi:glutathione S-transferase